MADSQKTFPCVCSWTGGSSARPWAEVAGSAEGDLAVRLHLEQCAAWRAGLGDAPDADTVSVFWKRARMDAHATFRK